MTPDEVRLRAATLRAQAQVIRSDARRTRALIADQVQQSRFRRAWRLARGGSDTPIETTTKRCPYCQSDAVTPAGRVSAQVGFLKVDYKCDGCGKPFVYLRRPIDFGPGPTASPASS